MSFKDELEKILDVDEVLVYLADKNDLEPFITSIINLVDKEKAKLNEELIDALENHKKTLDYIVKDNAPRNPTNYEVYLRKAIEVDTKIAQRAKLKGDK